MKAALLPDRGVIKVVGESGGRVDVDTDGDGIADNTGIDDAERQRLAVQYDPGKELWRVLIDHFSAWDYNYPYGLPQGATVPTGAPTGPSQSNACDPAGSIIGCTDQRLGEQIAIEGTDLDLVYDSTRVPDRTQQRTIAIPVTPATIPNGLESADVDVQVAGRTRSESDSHNHELGIGNQEFGTCAEYCIRIPNC